MVSNEIAAWLQGIKKRGPLQNRVLLESSCPFLSVAAGPAWAAWRRTACASCVDRICWRNGESGSEACVDEINFYVTAVFHEIVFYQKGQLFKSKGFVVFFWLIQSQSKRRASSAALHDRNAQSGIDFVLIHVVLQVFNCHLCYFQHGSTSFVKWIWNVKFKSIVKNIKNF